MQKCLFFYCDSAPLVFVAFLQPFFFFFFFGNKQTRAKKLASYGSARGYVRLTSFWGVMLK